MEKQPEAQASEATMRAPGSNRESIALTAGRGGILGVKAGMTQVYNENGDALAVTVIDLRPNVITQVKTMEKDGYIGVQVGMGDKKAKSGTKAEAGHAKKAGAEGFYYYEEFRMPENAKLDGIEIGKQLSPDFIKEGDFVDLQSISKGKGFQGVMKRYNYAGGFKSHGASVCHRQIGSIGNRADPGKVFKGKQMAGQMGNDRVTIQNLKVVRVDKDNGVILVHGSVPGAKSAVVRILKAVKKAK